MAENNYTVTKAADETGDNAKMLQFSEYTQYYTNGTIGGNPFSGWVSYNAISNDTSEIPIEDIDLWDEAVSKYIESYNKSLEDSEVKYVISETDSEAKSKYVKYVNGNKVDEGWGYYLDLNNDKDRSAWLDAVDVYNEKNDILSPTKEIKDIENKIKDKISTLDMNLPEMMDMIPPTLETLPTKLADDPCEFIDQVMRAAATLMTSGPSMAKEMLSYIKKATIFNENLAEDKIVYGSKSYVETAAQPVFNEIDESVDYFRELDASHREFVKRNNNAIIEFKFVAARAAESAVSEKYTITKMAGTETLPSIKVGSNTNYQAWGEAWDKWGSSLEIKDTKAYYTLLGQLLHESVGFKYMAEIGKGKNKSYGVPSGPYQQIYYGRGPIQVTWENNYKSIYNYFFKKVGLGDYNIWQNPDLALDPIIGSAASMGWIYTTKNGANLIKACNNYDIKAATKAINGGYNGLDDRIRRTEALWALL